MGQALRRRRAVVLIALAAAYAAAQSTFADVWVDGYRRSNGTYVEGHWRSDPDGDLRNNWSTEGNQNPYTGKWGTKKLPPGYGGPGYGGSYTSSSSSSSLNRSLHSLPNYAQGGTPSWFDSMSATPMNMPQGFGSRSYGPTVLRSNSYRPAVEEFAPTGSGSVAIDNPYFSAPPNQSATATTPMTRASAATVTKQGRTTAPPDNLAKRVAAIDYRGVGFATSRDQFLARFPGARVVELPNAHPRVSCYAIRDFERNIDLVSFHFLDERLMCLQYAYEGDRLRELGGASTLNENAKARFGPPHTEHALGLAWSFKEADRRVLAAGGEDVWTLTVSSLAAATEAKSLAAEAESLVDLGP